MPLKNCRRQCDVGHQCSKLRVLASGGQELNDSARVRGFDLINQQRQVFPCVLSDTKKEWKYPDALGSRSNQLGSCVGE